MARPKPLPHFVSWRFPTTANGRPFFSGSILAGRAVGHDLLVDGIFSAKTLIAAILAYYIALASQLERPYWSVITCYIVAQPLTGALMSKGVYRMMGTVIGAAVAIVMVPNLVDAPELLVLALALWLGTCTYVAALDRTPRSYVSLLAGYSAIIVAIPTVNAPETVFDVAIARVQEIGIGIACVSVVHALLFPKPVWHQVRDRLDRILEDAQVWSNEALAIPPRPEEVIWRDRRKLAADLHDLHLLSTHLPYDMTSPAIVPDMLREAEMQLGLLLPLASAVEDRIVALGEGGAQDLAGHGRLGALIEAVRVWIAKGAQQDPSALIARAHALEPDLETPESWAGLVQLSLLDRLTGLIQAHAAARALRDRLLDQAPAYPGQVRKAASPPQGELFPVSRRALHRDHRVAMRAAAATMLTVLITCAIWIATAWTDAGSAVVTAAIICALFSHLDAPLRAARHVFYGTIGAVLAAGLAAFLMIPHVTDFAGLCVMIAPFLLVMGWLFARPQRAPFGVGAVLIFPGLAGLDIAYESVFDTFVNQAGALMTGSFLACLVLSAVRATGAGTAALR
ncbi:MAG TPA: FUSC family protein, partial [Novosphingobium sp.]|nr:FUSC family protein [Novosphingobium sp.]